MPKYQHDNFGDVQGHLFAKGVITAVDSENDLADVTVEGYQDGSGVPLYYHCEPDSEKRSNGAIYGAAAAFSAGTVDDPTDGDEVIVMLEVNGAPVRIVGFVDGIKSCCLLSIIDNWTDYTWTGFETFALGCRWDYAHTNVGSPSYSESYSVLEDKATFSFESTGEILMGWLEMGGEHLWVSCGYYGYRKLYTTDLSVTTSDSSEHLYLIVDIETFTASQIPSEPGENITVEVWIYSDRGNYSIYGLTEAGKWAFDMEQIGVGDPWTINKVEIWVNVPAYWQWYTWQAAAPQVCISSYDISINSIQVCPNPGNATIWENP